MSKENNLPVESGLWLGVALVAVILGGRELIIGGRRLGQNLKIWAAGDRRMYENLGPGEFSVKPITSGRKKIFIDGDEVEPLKYPLSGTLTRVLDRD